MARKKIKVNYSSKIARRRERRARFKLGILLATPVLFVVVFVFVMRLDSLQIHDVSVSGVNTINSDEIKKEVVMDLEGNYLMLIPKKNIFFIDNKDIAGALLAQFGRLKTVQIETGINGTLRVEAEERTPHAIWCNKNSECHLMDESGLVYSSASEQEKRGRLVFFGETEKQDQIDKLFFKYANEIPEFFEIADYLKIHGIDANSFEVSSFEKASIYTNIGEIVFSPMSEEVLSAIDNAVLVFENEKKTKPEVKFQYIDVRFGSKVYYKTF